MNTTSSHENLPRFVVIFLSDLYFLLLSYDLEYSRALQTLALVVLRQAGRLLVALQVRWVVVQSPAQVTARDTTIPGSAVLSVILLQNYVMPDTVSFTFTASCIWPRKGVTAIIQV